MRRLPALALLLAACSSAELALPSEPLAGGRLVRDETAHAQTDSLSYTLVPEGPGHRARIAIAYTNALRERVFVVNCNGATNIRLEKLVDGRWTHVWSPVLPQCLSAPIVVEPGATHHTVVELWGAAPGGNHAPVFAATNFEGTYRLVWGEVVMRYDPSRHPFGEAVPAELRTSNRFVMR